MASGVNTTFRQIGIRRSIAGFGLIFTTLSATTWNTHSHRCQRWPPCAPMVTAIQQGMRAASSNPCRERRGILADAIQPAIAGASTTYSS